MLDISLVRIMFAVMLAATVIFAVFCAAKMIVKYSPGYYPLTSVLILMYAFVNLSSGVVHLGVFDNYDRGYFDATLGSYYDVFWMMLVSVLCSIGGTFSLIYGIFFGRVLFFWHLSESENIENSFARRLALFIAIIIFPLSVDAILVLNAYVSDGELRRVVALSDGMARYGFVSHWFSWSVSIISLAISREKYFDGSVRKLLLLTFSVVLIFWSLRWTGGRTVGVLMSAPLFMAIFSDVKKYRFPYIIMAAIFSLAYIVTISLYRSENYSNVSFGYLSVVDWEFGKYSMLSFAVDFVGKSGYLFGETIYAGFFSIIYGLIKSIGFGDFFSMPRLSMNITGEYILGDSSLIYIVPGLSSELYINFGIVGVFLGYFLIGIFSCYIEVMVIKSKGVINSIFYRYISVIIVFCTISAQSGAFFGYLFYIGFPLILVKSIDKFFSRGK